MRIFFIGENLFCVINYLGVDLEILVSDGFVIGIVLFLVYLIVCKFMFGFNLIF